MNNVLFKGLEFDITDSYRNKKAAILDFFKVKISNLFFTSFSGVHQILLKQLTNYTFLLREKTK